MFQVKAKSTLAVRHCAISLVFLLSCLVLPVTVQASTFEIHLAATGSDANSGLVKDEPIVSLNQAQEILFAHQPQGPVEIVIKKGVYKAQTVRWTYTNGEKIVFRAENESGLRPVFDGQGSLETWFTLSKRDGAPSRLEFRHLKVQNYSTAMNFYADRNNIDRGNSHNALESMYFYRIGGRFSEQAHSTAAVRFVNSSFNTIVNSHFVDILNPHKQAHLIHAVYMAHHSSGNTLRNNRFLRINGDPVKVRDSSNNNRIEANVFISTGKKAVFQDWYCQDGPDNCTKPTVECPSIGNVFTKNKLGIGYYGHVQTFDLWRSNTYCGELAKPRLRTAQNSGFGSMSTTTTSGGQAGSVPLN